MGPGLSWIPGSPWIIPQNPCKKRGRCSQSPRNFSPYCLNTFTGRSWRFHLFPAFFFATSSLSRYLWACGGIADWGRKKHVNHGVTANTDWTNYSTKHCDLRLQENLFRKNSWFLFPSWTVFLFKETKFFQLRFVKKKLKDVVTYNHNNRLLTPAFTVAVLEPRSCKISLIKCENLVEVRCRTVGCQKDMVEQFLLAKIMCHVSEERTYLQHTQFWYHLVMRCDETRSPVDQK